MTQEGTRSTIRMGAWAAIAIGLGWLGMVGLLWITAPRAVGINIRWVAGTAPGVQRRVADELHVNCERRIDARTWFCAVLDTSPSALERIVRHRAVEDTHHVNRGTFVLENAPPADTRLWVGNESRVIGSIVVQGGALVLALCGIIGLLGSPKRT